MSFRFISFCILFSALLIVPPVLAQNEGAVDPTKAVEDAANQAGQTAEEIKETVEEGIEKAAEGLGLQNNEGDKAAEKEKLTGIRKVEKQIDEFFGDYFVKPLEAVLFFNLTPGEPHKDADGNDIIGPAGKPVETTVPFIVLWLVVAAVFFTFRMGFVNFRMFGHAVQVVLGKYDNPDDKGEVTSFQALSSALSATVGLGNIAGVAIAISLGGPGAMFWMVMAGLLGMTLKFTECTLGQKYRHIDEDGNISGGPMHYLKEGFAKRGLGGIGIPMAILFTICCIGGSFAGGNAFQVYQSKGILAEQFPWFKDNGIVYGVIMAVAVAFVIIGGFKRIAQVAEKIVPSMCGMYVLASLVILAFNAGAIPSAIGAIFQGAFSGEAIYGGALGALIMGFRRAAFSNEAGVGSASIAHSAAKTPYPVREGIVALLEPFIDTVVVCSITALVIIITGVYNNPDHASLISGSDGAALTNEAFKSVEFMAGWFPYLLTVAVILFAFSTMISWSYYGERCWTTLFGTKTSIVYKLIFIGFVVLGSILSGTNALAFGDLMIFLMALPNIIGLFVLQGDVRAELASYEKDLHAGNFKVYK